MSFSISEILLILVIAVLVVKPEQMPDVAFSLGRFISSVRRMFDKVKDEMSGIMDSVEKPVPRPSSTATSSNVIEGTVIEKVENR